MAAGALAALGRYVEALADADKCCQLRPDWYKSHVRGWAYVRCHVYEDLMAYFGLFMQNYAYVMMFLEV